MNKKNKSNKNKKKPIDPVIKFMAYGVTILILVILTLALVPKVVPPNEEDGYYYNGFSFQKVGQSWYTQIMLGNERLYTIELRYGPRELEEIPIIGTPEQIVGLKALYVSFNPIDEELKYVGLATADLQMNLIKVLGIKPVAACTNNQSDACLDIPIKNCDNTEAPIIVIEQDPVAYVEQKDNCLVIKGKDEELVKSVDRLLLYLYGIMR